MKEQKQKAQLLKAASKKIQKAKKAPKVVPAKAKKELTKVKQAKE